MSNAATVVKAEKTVPNLTTVIPMGEPPEGPEFDTTTPMDDSIAAFSQRDAKWYPWLHARMQRIWPHLTTLNFPGQILQVVADNSILLIRTKKAILMAVRTKKVLEPRPNIEIVFCFKFHPENAEENKFARPLFRRVEEWGKTCGAKYVRIENPQHIDVSPSQMKDMFWGKEATIMVKDLDPKEAKGAA